MSFAQWHPTAQIMWVKKKDGVTLLCQAWVEVIPGAKGPQQTGNMRLQEIPIVDEPDAENEEPATAEEPKSGLIL